MFTVWYHTLRARRVLTQRPSGSQQNIPTMFHWEPEGRYHVLYEIYGASALLIRSGASLNSVTALLVLNGKSLNSVSDLLVLNGKSLNSVTALLVLNGKSLNSVSDLLVLNGKSLNSVSDLLVLNGKSLNCVSDLLVLSRFRDATVQGFKETLKIIQEKNNWNMKSKSNVMGFLNVCIKLNLHFYQMGFRSGEPLASHWLKCLLHSECHYSNSSGFFKTSLYHRCRVKEHICHEQLHDRLNKLCECGHLTQYKIWKNEYWKNPSDLCKWTNKTNLLTRSRRFEFAITPIFHRLQPEYTRD